MLKKGKWYDLKRIRRDRLKRPLGLKNKDVVEVVHENREPTGQGVNARWVVWGDKRLVGFKVVRFADE